MREMNTTDQNISSMIISAAPPAESLQVPARAMVLSRRARLKSSNSTFRGSRTARVQRKPFLENNIRPVVQPARRNSEHPQPEKFERKVTPSDTRQLKARGAARVTGVDLSERMIDLARVQEAAHPIGIENYYLDVALHEVALLSAGFREVRWHSPKLSTEGETSFGADFWRTFLDHSPVAFLECVK
jgi:hypothetical protein